MGTTSSTPAPLSQRGAVLVAFVADGRDHRSLGAVDRMGLEPKLLDALDHVLDLFLTGALLHYHNHWEGLLGVGANKKSPEILLGLGASFPVAFSQRLAVHTSFGPATRRVKVKPEIGRVGSAHVS